jgi:hypothetical protein
MSSISEHDIQDFLRKTGEFLTELPLDARELALDEWRQILRAYAQNNPHTDWTKLKLTIGGPRGLANIIRLKLGHPLQPNPNSNIKRAVLMTVMISLAVTALLIGFVWWKFTPLLSVEEDRVQVLGGLIDIDGQLGQVKVGDNFEFSEAQYKNIFEGTFPVPESIEDTVIEFDRGQLEISYTPDNLIAWNCKVSSEPSDGFIGQEKDVIVVNLKSVGGTDCSFKVPSRMKHTINGDAGKIDLIAPSNDTFVQLGNGLVSITPDSELSYRFDLKAGHGLVDGSFSKMSSENGIEIKVDLGNGQIQKK